MIAQRRGVFRAPLPADDGLCGRQRQALPPELSQRMLAAGDRVDSRERRAGEKLRIASALPLAGGPRPIWREWEDGRGIGDDSCA